MTKYRIESTYLKEDHYKSPKEYFKIFAKKISGRKNDNVNFFDVGCATGSLINFLNGKYPNWNYSALEPSKAMIKIAKKYNKEAKFYNSEIKNFTSKEKFDVISLFGVLGIFNFEEGKKTIKKLIKMLKVDGELFVFSYFNDHDVDVLINHRKYYDNKLGKLESGWNIYSKKRLKDFSRRKEFLISFIIFQCLSKLRKKRSY